MKNTTLNRTVTYKCFCQVSKKIAFLEESKMRKCLAPVMGDITHARRCDSYATVAVKFRTIDEAGKQSGKTLTTEEAMLLLFYMGRRTSKINIKDIPAEAEVSSVTAALLRGRDGRVTVLQITRTHEKL